MTLNKFIEAVEDFNKRTVAVRRYTVITDLHRYELTALVDLVIILEKYKEHDAYLIVHASASTKEDDLLMACWEIHTNSGEIKIDNIHPSYAMAAVSDFRANEIMSTLARVAGQVRREDFKETGAYKLMSELYGCFNSKGGLEPEALDMALRRIIQAHEEVTGTKLRTTDMPTGVLRA